MTPADLQFRIDESERMLVWACDQAQMAFDEHRDAHRLGREIEGAYEAHALNLAVAKAEYDFGLPAANVCRVRMFRVSGDNGSRSHA